MSKKAKGGKKMKILDEYKAELNNFEILKNTVLEILEHKIKENNIENINIDCRIKSEESLIDKIEKKGKKYKSLKDITDIFGARIITLYSDTIEEVSEIIEDLFEIDRENSIDKGKTLNDSEFGYLSVHYICSLPKNSGYPEELCRYRFEIQLRSCLQHIWSEMNHDIGYKSIFKLPHSCMRSFSKLASLMEIADEMACNLRDDINNYIQEVHNKIAENRAFDIEINKISIREYVKNNDHMMSFFKQITDECGIEITYTKFDTDILLKEIEWLGFRNLGDIQKMFEHCRNIAISFVHYTFDHSDIDIISSSAGLRFMFNAELIFRNTSKKEIENFYSISINDNEICSKYADDLLKFKKTLKEY